MLDVVGAHEGRRAGYHGRNLGRGFESTYRVIPM